MLQLDDTCQLITLTWATSSASSLLWRGQRLTMLWSFLSWSCVALMPVEFRFSSRFIANCDLGRQCICSEQRKSKQTMNLQLILESLLRQSRHRHDRIHKPYRFLEATQSRLHMDSTMRHHSTDTSCHDGHYERPGPHLKSHKSVCCGS